MHMLVRKPTTHKAATLEAEMDTKGILKRLPPAVLGLEVPNERRISDLGASAYWKDLLTKTKRFLENVETVFA